MIREVKEHDAEALLQLIKQVDSESAYMLHDPNERTTTVESLRKMITTFAKEHNSIILVAEEDGQLAGYFLAVGGKVNRTRHSAYLVIGILREHRGTGIGTAFFTKAEKWAWEHGLHRLELTAVIENEAAVGLYKKAGFVIEGVKKHSLCIEGTFKDEYYMAKLL
ncbi:GNAT family N-acetyltransferase [Lentibacillus sp. Marseille-P4043]|uniref:GNAT family N-acetyltransferase n=1 Tax=Lentibacillus sp. Marseille-P4043 TaxID=2040293 RepID=UPI000D0B5DFB|nr:GNAT family N-acetyltransferase [Lentibacillus sp. Marseille-P4043]